MGRALRRAKFRRDPLSESWERFFSSGAEFGPNTGEPGQWGVALEWYRHNDMWREHGVTFVADWIKQSPGSRPWAWWNWDAAEARDVVRGAQLLVPKSAPSDWEWVWRGNFGIPAFVQCRPRGFVGLPAVEAQAVYLGRLGLLDAAERAALGADAFTPEEHNAFHVDDDDEQLLGRRGPR